MSLLGTQRVPEFAMTGIKEIARKADVSVSTVRRALNDLPDIDPATKKKILGIAKKLNYQKNLLASSLARQKTNIVGVIIPDLEMSFYPALVLGIETRSKSSNYRMLLYHSNYTLDGLVEGLHTFASYRVDGMVVVPVPSGAKKEIVSSLKKLKVPCVFADEYFEDAGISYVSTDDVKGAIAAIDYLVSLGHRRIAHFAGDLSDATAQNRLEGYRQALRKAKIPYEKSLVVGAGVTREKGEKAAEKLLGMTKVPSALFCYNDAVAIGAMRVFTDRGLKMPEDISIIGYGGLQNMDVLKVPLSTVSQPAREIGEKAAGMLIDEIEGRSKNGQKILLDTKLVVRESCRRQKE